MEKKSCFVAYSSEPVALSETIEGAIDLIRGGGLVNIDSWKSTAEPGRIVISSICEAIAKRDIFICDLTYLNSNVLFELGYAIAQNKRIWVLLNPSITQAQEDYKKLPFLTTIIYAAYHNSRDIENIFCAEQPYESIEKTVYNDVIRSLIIPIPKRDRLLYHKSYVETDASIKLSRRIANSTVPSIVDDPKEVRFQSLIWYAQHAYSSYAVVAHFLSQDHIEHNFHNSKNAFVSGLAYGFGRYLLMIAHEPYRTPIDYRDLLKTHKTALQCDTLSNSWMTEIENKYSSRDADVKAHTETVRAQAELQTISIGEYIAEQEKDNLSDYFLQTAAFNEALKSHHSIFIGRKGVGKTANFFQLVEELRQDVRNHICIIKPIGYELDGIIRMLSQALPLSEKGFLIESFWKFLVYTELSKSIFEALKIKPAYYQQTVDEKQLYDFVLKKEEIILPEFSIRLETAVKILQNISGAESAKDKRIKISELLHGSIISTLRMFLGRVLAKKGRTVILVDNLDKAWQPSSEIELLSQLLFGLLRVSQNIVHDFEKSDERIKSVKLSLIVFLRSDIFSYIIKYAREKDKIPFYRIVWEDRDTLIRVLEERFLKYVVSEPSEIWGRYFCPRVKNKETREYMIDKILPRPRDIIYLAKAALATAINRGHARIEENDIIEAEKQYSQYALDSILIENGIRITQLESLLFEFIGSNVIITTEDISSAMKRSSIGQDKLNDIIELLCDLTFIGLEIEPNKFAFLYNEDLKTKFHAMSRKVIEHQPDKTRRFKINEPFHNYLEIKSI